MLDSITAWLQLNPAASLWVIPAIAFAEACVGLGLFVSGAILVAVCSFLYGEGIASAPTMMALAFAGACASDHLGFYIGRWLGPNFHSSQFAQRHAKKLAKSEALIQKYGWGAILIGRLLTAIRSLVPLLTGISGFSRLRYTIFDILACTIWSAGLGAIVLGVDSAIG